MSHHNTALIHLELLQNAFFFFLFWSLFFLLLIYCTIFSLLCFTASSALTPLQATGGEVKIITSPNLHCQRIESDGSNCTNGPIRGQRDREHSVISPLPPLFSNTADKHLSYHNPHTSKNKLLLFFISFFYRRKNRVVLEANMFFWMAMKNP